MMEHACLLRPRGYLLRLAHCAILVLFAGAAGAWAAESPPAEGPMSCESTAVSTGAADSTAEPTPIGPGDLLSINVYGQDDLTGTQVVAGDGTVRIALVEKPLHVSGLSL